MNNKNKLTARQKKALATKKNLFESAIELFRKKGYYGVSVDEITTKAGTSKGTFYTYFKSKDQILLEQFKQYDIHHNIFYKKLKKYQSAKEKLLTFVKEVYVFTTKKVGLKIIYIIYATQLSYSKKNTFIIEENRPLYKIIREIIKEGQRNGEFRTDIEAKECTKMIVRCLRGTLYDWCLYDGKFDVIEDGMRFFSFFIEGIIKVSSTVRKI